MSNNIELINQPPQIALLNDGLYYKVQSVRDFSGGFAELIIDMSLTQANYIDNYFTLSFNGVEIPFYFRDNPNQSGTELPTWNVNDSFSEFLTLVIQALNANYFINKDYVVTGFSEEPTNRILIKAKNIGTEYNIDLVDSTVTGLSVNSLLAGIVSTIPADYRIYFEPYIYSDNILYAKSLGKDVLSIDNEQNALVDVSEYVDNEIKTQFSYPFNGKYQRILEDAVLKMFIKYAEFEDSTPQLLRDSFQTPVYVIRGGLNSLDSELLNGDGFNYFDYQDNLKKFLTHAPIIKITYPDVPELLFFYISTDENINIILKTITSDGTITISTVDQIKEAQQNKIVELNVGLSDLLIGQLIDDFVYYEIYLENELQELVSEVRAYNVDHSYYENKRVIFFQNSFDLYETFCFTGELTVSDNFKRTIVEVSKDMTFKHEISSTTNLPLYSISSGYLRDKKYRSWLTDLMLSKDSFLMLGHILMPIMIKQKKLLNHTDKDSLYSITASFTPDFDESRFSSVIGDGIYFLLNEDGIIILNENDIGLIAATL